MSFDASPKRQRETSSLALRAGFQAVPKQSSPPTESLRSLPRAASLSCIFSLRSARDADESNAHSDAHPEFNTSSLARWHSGHPESLLFHTL
jgi:hypothetical protein